MMVRCCKGQNMMEFAIILGLVVVCSIAAWSLLGDNIMAMFSSSNDKVASFDPFNVKETGGNAKAMGIDGDKGADGGAEDATPGPAPIVKESKTVGGKSVNIMTDGSATISFATQDVTLSSTILNNLNEVFETSGSDGLNTYIVNALEKMIQAHEAEHTDGVPIEIGFGTGKRTEIGHCAFLFFGCDPDITTEGKTKIIEHDDGTTETVPASNSITLKVGDHLMIIQNDQSSSNGKLGTYIIDGNIVPKKDTFLGFTIDKYTNFEGKISMLGGSSNYIQNGWDFVVDHYDPSKGLTFNGQIEPDFFADEGSWNISFGDLYQIGTTKAAI